MKSQTLIAHGRPLEERETGTPAPQGTEVLLRVRHCGVCHSDVHLHDGYFELGGEDRLDLTGAHELPFVLGHEIEGEVEAVGPDAGGIAAGERRVVYPWIGCGECALCARGDEQLCGRPRAIGVNRDGGYSDRVLVPHPRYLLDYGSIPETLAGLYMCSGLTAYSALGKLGGLPPGTALVVVGLGGVGMMGLRFARALYPDAALIGADVDEDKLEAARAAGLDAAYDARDPDTPKRISKETGGALAAIDFVGSEASLGLATGVLGKGGRAVVVGLFGGRLTMPIPMLPLRAISLVGSYVGTLAEAAAMLARVEAGGVEPIPVALRPLAEANAALDDLRAGRVLGRTVLDIAAG